MKNERWLTEADVRKLIAEEIQRHGSGHKLAKKWGLTPPFLNMVLHGRRSPSPIILQWLGLERRTLYRAKPSRPWLP